MHRITTRTVAATPEHLLESDPAQPELWETWVEGLKYVVLFQDIKGKEKKKAFLLNSCGIATLRLVQGLITPTTLEVATYNTLIVALTKIAADFANWPSHSLPQTCRAASRPQSGGSHQAGWMLRQLDTFEPQANSASVSVYQYMKKSEVREDAVSV
ncbi:UNVERIFIED_CONTAM: hypothetical protein K2H54_055744 [Gekko kuhli]